MENEDLKDFEQEKTIDTETVVQVNPETEVAEQVNPEDAKIDIAEKASEVVGIEENTVADGNVATEEGHDIAAEPVLVADDEIDKTDEMKLILERISEKVEGIATSSAKTAGEIREMHKLYHNEFANRLKSMQEKLDRYQEIEGGRIFDEILTDLSKVYSKFEFLLENATDEKNKKNLGNMFAAILDILKMYGVTMLKSKHGDKCNIRYCEVSERISTDNSELRDIIALSKNTGFYIGNRPLVKEVVDVYLYTAKTVAPQQAADELKLS